MEIMKSLETKNLYRCTACGLDLLLESETTYAAQPCPNCAGARRRVIPAEVHEVNMEDMVEEFQANLNRAEDKNEETYYAEYYGHEQQRLARLELKVIQAMRDLVLAAVGEPTLGRESAVALKQIVQGDLPHRLDY